MIIQAELRRKQSEYEGEACSVDKVIELPAQRFKQFSRALLADYDFIAENKNAVRHDEAARHCLLILNAEGKDGFLVDPQGYNYARYSALVPNARSLLTPDMGIDRSYLSPAEPWRNENRDEMLRMTLRVDGKPDYTLVLPADEEYLDAVKTYLDTVRHRNTGACEQYYVEGTHPPIISKEVFTKVQILIQMRKENYGKSPSETIHPLSRKAICGCCGTVLRRKPQRGKYYWCCMRHDTNREECPLMPISETSLCESFCRLYYKLKHQSIPILEQMLTNLQMIRNRRMLWSPDIVALNKRISDLSSQNQTLAFLKQQGLVDPDIFIAKTNELTKQLRQAKLEKEKLMDAESDMTALQTRDLIDLLEGGPEFLDSFDAELFGELVEKIIIESNDSVRFCLKNVLELRESIERTVR